jgi:hypothetical protein
MKSGSSRPPQVVLLNRRRGSGSAATLPARKPVESEVRRGELLLRRAS